MKDAYINFRCSKELKALVEKLAAKDKRTVSNYLTMLIEKEGKKKEV